MLTYSKIIMMVFLKLLLDIALIHQETSITLLLWLVTVPKEQLISGSLKTLGPLTGEKMVTSESRKERTLVVSKLKFYP